jgi:hypothetical protein
MSRDCGGAFKCVPILHNPQTSLRLPMSPMTSRFWHRECYRDFSPTILFEPPPTPSLSLTCLFRRRRILLR